MNKVWKDSKKKYRWHRARLQVVGVIITTFSVGVTALGVYYGSRSLFVLGASNIPLGIYVVYLGRAADQLFYRKWK